MAPTDTCDCVPRNIARTLHLQQRLGHQETAVHVATLDFVHFVGGLRESRGYFAIPPTFGHHKRVRVANPPLIVSKLLEIPAIIGVALQFHLLLGPQQGKGPADNFHFVPFLDEPQTTKGYIAITTIFLKYKLSIGSNPGA